jgi:formylglycine-generating enzyme required for sulfatase activity
MRSLLRRLRRFGLCLLLPLLLWGVYMAWHGWQRSRQERQAYEPAPPGMVLVPAGSFLMGSAAPAPADEQPVRRLHLPAFYIDIHEVTNRQYQLFDNSHTYAAGADDLPVTGVRKHQAAAYAAAFGRRLPSRAEWEKAARGDDGRLYPWGDVFESSRANVRSPGQTARGLMPVGSFPAGVSPYGCYDMAGNAWEWVADSHREAPLLDPRWRQRRGVLKGGAHGYSAFQARAAYNGFEDERTTCNDVGFRCAADAVPKRP